MKKQLLVLAMCFIGIFTLNISQAQKTTKERKLQNVLNLTTDQQSKIKALKKSQKEQVKVIKADTTLSEVDKKKQLKELHSSFSKQEREILTPEQQAKQDSLRASHKRFGKGGKNGKTTFSKLNLSNEQKKSLKSLHQAQKEKIDAVKSNTTFSDQEKQQQITSIRKEGRSEFEKLLTLDQKLKLQQMRHSKKSVPTSVNS